MERRILVTGASTGIGRACALHLAARGATVFAGVRAASDGDALVAAAAGDLRPVALDVTDAASIRAAAETVGDAPLAGLVNNAGIVVAGPVELVPLDAWRRQLEVNVLGVVAVTQALLPLVRAATGRIVNVGSIAGRCPLPCQGPYDASKFALEAITDDLRMELRRWKIRVALIEPGAIATPIWEKSLAAAAALADGIAPERVALYAGLVDAVRAAAAAAARDAIPPAEVVRAVEHALTARRPRTRYVIGRQARSMLALGVLPDRWRDALVCGRLRW